MMESGSVLRQALKLVREALKSEGYSVKGMAFHRQSSEGNTMVLSLQKSAKSDSSETLVAVNYGVYSGIIGARLGEDTSVATNVAKAHWRKRLSAQGREIWLNVAADMTAREAADLILESIHSAQAELDAHSTNEVLRDEWFRGSSPGLTAVQRGLFLAILVDQIGPSDRLPDVLAGIRRLGTHSNAIEQQLADLGVKEPK